MARRGPQLLALSSLALALALACRGPKTQEGAAPPASEGAAGEEPSGRDAAAIFVEAPTVDTGPGPELDWSKVDGSLSHLIPEQRLRVDYTAAHPWLGASSPLVTIVVFTDYQCPYCKRLDETLAQVLARFSQDVRVVYRQFPLPMHQQAKPAARFALAAHAQGMFAPMHAWLFEHARDLDPAKLEAQARRLGLDPARMRADLDGDPITNMIAEDMKVGAHFDVTGTPAMFINGRSLRGAQPYEELEAIVREEITTAEQLLAAGSDRSEVWARFMVASLDAVPKIRDGVPSRLDPDKRYDMALAGLPERGAAKAKVEILMCGDFDCPYSARSTATLEALLKAHPKDLAIYFRHRPLPMHKQARAAHRAAVAAANQGKFWDMFDLLYARQKERSTQELEAMAKEIGLNMKRFRKDIAAAKTDELIDEHSAHCESLDGTGTPTFYVNGLIVSGAQPEAVFEELIAAELAGGKAP